MNRDHGRPLLEGLESRQLLSTFLVDLSTDESDGSYGAGDLSLREAVELANADPDVDVIGFSSALSGSVLTLTLGEIAVTEEVTIAGTDESGADADITLASDGSSRLFSISGASVTLEQLALTGGDEGSGLGGAVYGASDADVTVTGCTLTGNTANRGGAIAIDGGTLTISDSTISGNTGHDSGGGVYTSASSTTTITGSTISGNDAGTGGAIRNRGTTMTVTSCTISGNAAESYGGALFNQGAATIANSTITLNVSDSGDVGFGFGGIYASSGAIVMTSTIVAGNTLGDGSTASDIKTGTGSINSGSSNNLIGDSSSAGGLSDGVNGNIVGDDPLLDGLADNGGATLTHALLPGSPALQAGSAAVDVTTDQRGYSRTGGAAPDIGAFESHTPTIGGLGASVSTFYRGDEVTLEASSVVDDDDNVAQVAFYADADDDGIADSGELLGTDSDGSDGYSLDLSGAQTDLFATGDLTFLAVATDSQGYESDAASTSVTIEHRPPVIGGIDTDASTLFRGDTLGLTATGVVDGDSAVASVAFYYDSNGDRIADIGELLGTDADGSNGFRLQLTGGQTAAFDLGDLEMLAVATDSMGYESDAVSTLVTIEYRDPELGGVTADVSTLFRGETFGLTATGAVDGDSAVASVSFYIDRDGDGTADGDELLGTDADGSNGFGLLVTGAQTEVFGLGSVTILAVATDGLGYKSGTVSTSLTVEHRAPTIGGLGADVDSLYRGQQITLTAEGVAAGDAAVSSVSFYLDANGDGIGSIGELLGTDSSSAGGYSLVVSGSQTAGFALGAARFLAVATDGSGYTSDAVSLDATMEYRLCTVGALETSVDALRRGAALTLTASGIEDGDSAAGEVRFYLDADGDGIADADELLGADTDGSDGFTLALTGADTALFSLGQLRLLAVAVDGLGHESDPASALVTVASTPPTISGLSSSATTIAEGDQLTLTAEGVGELGGAPAGVRFYLDADGDGVADPDELLGTDTDGSDGYTWTLSADDTLALGRGERTFLAAAIDLLGDSSETALTSVTVEYAQDGSVDSPVQLASAGGDDLLSVTRNGAGDLVVFIQNGDAWESVHLRDATGAPAATGDAVVWTDDGLTYIAGPSVEGFILYTRAADGTWSFRNLTTELGVGSDSPVGMLTQFVSRPRQGAGMALIAGVSESGEMVAFRQTGVDEAGDPVWAFVNISDDLASQGMSTPVFSELISYVTPWNTWTIAGVDGNGDIQSVWLAPNSFTKWRVDNLSDITGAPPIVGQLSVTQTSWKAINLGGVNQQGHLVVTWWVPSFGGRWVTSDLTSVSGGATLAPGKATGYTTSWGAINYIGFNDDGEVTAYWWTPQNNSWIVTPLTAGLSDDVARPVGHLTSRVSDAGTMSIVGTGAGGEVLRLWWSPGTDNQWHLTDLSEAASRGE